MVKKSGLMRVDNDFKKYIKKVQIELGKKGIMVSERRITLALTRVPGQKELLMNSNWLDEEIRRTRI